MLRKVDMVRLGLTSFLCFLPFIMFAVFYPLYKKIRCDGGMNELFPIQLYAIYNLERSIFRFLPHTLSNYYGNAVLDVLMCIPYLLHFALPVFYAVYLLYLRLRMYKVDRLNFVVGYSTVIILLLQYFSPTAPPWYLDHYGSYNESIARQIECLPSKNYSMFIDKKMMIGRFRFVDELFNSDFFERIYGNSVIIFGSFPSMHTSWPASICFSRVYPMRFRFVGYVHLAWIMFAAVYSGHHYVMDVLAAALLVLLLTIFYNKVLYRLTYIGKSEIDSKKYNKICATATDLV